MSSSGKPRHRDREPGRREDEDALVAPRDRDFRLPDAERQEIAKALRYIDDARRALEAQQNPDNREIIRELKASADRIYDLINGLEEVGEGRDGAKE